MLVSAGVAHFGSGMLGTGAGMAALTAWAAAKAADVNAVYIAFDTDVLDGSGGWAIQMPETNGLSLDTALAAISILARSMPVAGFGATGINLDHGDPARTLDAVVRLSAAAFG
jgi:arginase family enzyme